MLLIETLIKSPPSGGHFSVQALTRRGSQHESCHGDQESRDT